MEETQGYGPNERSRPKLWEEMTTEEQASQRASWDEDGRKYREEVERRYFEGQSVLRLLRHRPGVECIKEGTPCEVSTTPLPDEPGHYLWYIVDWGYLNVGMVQVMKDPEKHLAYLRERFAQGCRGSLVYQNSKAEALSMYHEAHDHLPPRNKDGVPWVDGYVKIDFDIFKLEPMGAPPRPVPVLTFKSQP